jgi:hypothetical protein
VSKSHPEWVQYPVCWFTEKGDLEEVIELIEKRDHNINERDNFGNTPLHCACRKKHVSIATYLIEKGADINAQNQHGYTPLHLSGGEPGIAELLLSRGAATYFRNARGQTALDYAIEYKHDAVVDLIRKHRPGDPLPTKEAQISLAEAPVAHTPIAQRWWRFWKNIPATPLETGTQTSTIQPLEPTVSPVLQATSLHDSATAEGGLLQKQLLSAAGGRESHRIQGWQDYDGVLNNLGCQFQLPGDWVRSQQGNMTIFQPIKHRKVYENGTLFISPRLTFFCMGDCSVQGDELLDKFIEQRSTFPGFVHRDTCRFAVDGLLMAAVHHDFKRESGTWSAIATGRAYGKNFVFFEASGVRVDIDRLREQLVTILGALKVALPSKAAGG